MQREVKGKVAQMRVMKACNGKITCGEGFKRKGNE